MGSFINLHTNRFQLQTEFRACDEVDQESSVDVHTLSRSLFIPRMDSSSPQNNSKPQKKSLFTRKPVKRSNADTPRPSSSFTSPPDPSSTLDSVPDPLPSSSSISREPSLDALSSSPNRSIIPESLKELPSWYHTEGEWAAASAHQFRARYPIHNPVGPQFYANVHLSSPVRPASVFSPSFPPMHTEPASAPSPPHTPPSGSPLPTPSSSQTRILDLSGKIRTRKLSNTAHDTVDLLDGSDPYGTNWHHESPYDGWGLTGDRTVLSSDVPDVRCSFSNFFFFFMCYRNEPPIIYLSRDLRPRVLAQPHFTRLPHLHLCLNLPLRYTSPHPISMCPPSVVRSPSGGNLSRVSLVYLPLHHVPILPQSHPPPSHRPLGP
jgi:hypothetical protein